MTLGQRFARLTTNVVVRVPGAWRLFRGRMAVQFDALAPEWDATRARPERFAALRAALEAVPEPPARALDIGTGSGAAARAAAEIWPEAEVVGVDLSQKMVEEARRLASSDRERYDLGDASALPFESGSFGVVFLNNMIPFFDELTRVLAPGGHVAVAYSMGAKTPIYVPLGRVRAELERRGFAHVGDFTVEPGVALLAKRGEPS